eukprot:scaffold5475_cov50-Phaeocystis_antarctica.AAC.2
MRNLRRKSSGEGSCEGCMWRKNTSGNGTALQTFATALLPRRCCQGRGFGVRAETWAGRNFLTVERMRSLYARSVHRGKSVERRGWRRQWRLVGQVLSVRAWWCGRGDDRGSLGQWPVASWLCGQAARGA